jgi:hypothetical protein
MLGNRFERGGAKDLLLTPDIPRSDGSPSCGHTQSLRLGPTRQHERGLGLAYSDHVIAYSRPLLAKPRRARGGEDAGDCTWAQGNRPVSGSQHRGCEHDQRDLAR